MYLKQFLNLLAAAMLLTVVAMVSPFGNVGGRSAGVAVITVTTADGHHEARYQQQSTEEILFSK